MVPIPLVSSQPASFLFDRARNSHPWLAALGTLQGSSMPGHAPLAQNWRMDVRVDAEREAHLVSAGCFPSGSSGGGFDAAISEYFAHFLCRSPAAVPCADYAENANRSNLIPFEERPARNHRLLHLASVNSLLRRLMKPSVAAKVDFEIAVVRLTGIRLPATPGGSDIDRLVTALQTKGLDTIKGFAQAISEGLGNSEPHWWAAFSHEIGALSAVFDWTDAVRKTGQGHVEQGEWMLAWRYSPELAGKLYRPTVAEAGSYAFHFPSPPLASYGIAMPLAAGLPVVRELIHAPLKGEISAEACIGFGRIVNIPVVVRGPHDIAPWFQKRRREHGQALVQNQPPEIPARSWLQRHAILT